LKLPESLCVLFLRGEALKAVGFLPAMDLPWL